MSNSDAAKLIFDMDGVITGEDSYWDAAALVVWELFFSSSYLGFKPPERLPCFCPDPSPDVISKVRRQIFDSDRTVAFFKKRAVNSNWDLAFLSFSYYLIRLMEGLEKRGESAPSFSIPEGEEPGIRHLHEFGRLLPEFAAEHLSFSSPEESWADGARGELELMDRLLRMAPLKIKEVLAGMLRPHSLFWKGVQRVFQEWYFGGEKYFEIYREKPLEPTKEGLIFREEPLLPAGKIEKTLQQLEQQGWVLGIATGRPLNELCPPLKQMGLWDYFDPFSVVTFTEVEEAEERLACRAAEEERLSLRKPHPFSFLKAYFAGEKEERELIEPPFPRPQWEKCWVIGDSMADLEAARQMGTPFVGVLTGHGGKNNRELFLREGAATVLPDVTALPGFLKEARSSF